MQTIDVSIIICTYNRDHFLRLLLQSLEDQVHGELPGTYDVLVVDNNCIDDTPAVVEDFAKRGMRVRRVVETAQGLSNARNCGARESTATYLCFLDDDAVLPEHYLERLMDNLTTVEPDILGGPVFPYFKDKKPFWFRDKYEIRKHAEETGYQPNGKVSGGNFVIRGDLLSTLGGFDPNFGMIGGKVRMGEERMLVEDYKRATPKPARKLYYDLDMFIRHYTSPDKMRIRYIMHRSYKSGVAITLIKNKNPRRALAITMSYVPRMVAFAFREIWENGPFKADYPGILAEWAVRWGNIVALWSQGPGVVFKLLLRYHYLSLRPKLKKRNKKWSRRVATFEEKTGIYRWLK